MMQLNETINVRQVIYQMGMNGKAKIAAEALRLVDDETIVDYGDLFESAILMGADVDATMEPSTILEIMVATEQYAKFH